MAADAFIHCRVAPEIKAALRAAAARENLTESALIKQLLTAMIRGQLGANPDSALTSPTTPRDSRLYVRLEPSDRLLVQSRAASRGMASATYVAVLVRSHLRSLAPLASEELRALKQVVGQLSACGRLLNQMARELSQGQPSAVPGRQEVVTMLNLCTGLRDHVQRLLVANARSWRLGHEQNPG